MIIVIIVIILVLIIPLTCLYLLIRNEFVCDYLIDLCDRIYIQGNKDIENSHKPIFYYTDMPTYERVLFSFKPIKDKYWLSEEFIEWLNR